MFIIAIFGITSIGIFLFELRNLYIIIHSKRVEAVINNAEYHTGGVITYYYDILINGKIETVKETKKAGFLSTWFPKINIGKKVFIRYSNKINNIAPNLSFTVLALVLSSFFIMLSIFMYITK